MQASITPARSGAKTREWRGGGVEEQEQDRERGMTKDGNDGRALKGWAEEMKRGL